MLKWIAGGIAAFFTGRYLFRLNKASDTVVTRTAVKVRKVGLSGMELQASVRLQNPNPIDLNIRYPFVNLMVNDTSIGSSEAKDEIITLPANDEKSFHVTIRTVGWLALVQVLGAPLVEKIRKGEKVLVDLVSTITSEVNGFPYSKKENVQLSI